MSALRFSSLFGVFCTVYLVLAVTIVFWVDKKLNKNPVENFNKAKLFDFSFDGFANCVPLIIFAYMYQVNIPSIYIELEKRNYKSMSVVVSVGSTIAVICYSAIGIFGYVTFVNTPDVLDE